jgi:uroporphyrin-III C-methyltransferase
MVNAVTPKVTLVGAGPGDAELITLRGLKALRSASVVLYDALVNEELLAEAPKSARRIFVGKRAGHHRFRQEEINRLLVQSALLHGHVVRLKGGDPFVFGRGHEELTYVAQFGIETAVVPGISSCIALPELQGVPVTRRRCSESFWVLTGTTRRGTLSEDVALAARSSATVVILMGMRKLREIANLFSEQGKADLPAMVIQNGSLPTEKCVLGHVRDIAERVEAAGVGSPGIIVLGEAAALHPEWLGAAVAKMELG